jgi:hypothetical protein
MAVSSLVSVVFKVHLMRRRIHQRRAAATARAARATFTPAARQAALRMLMERFVLRHDQLDFEERKSAHDAQRYQCYGYLLGIVSEVRTVFRDAAGLFSAHVRLSLERMPTDWPAGRAIRRDQRDLLDAHRRQARHEARAM